MRPIFITGIGTEIGKTVTSAIVTEALRAAYWKPVQAGFEHGTDSQWVASMVSDPGTPIWKETYKLALPASPHIAARQEGLRIDLDRIANQLKDQLDSAEQDTPDRDFVVIEGAGGLLVPLNDHEFIADLAAKLDATVILVSRNYLGSINHSLLTAAYCQQVGLKVAGWIFNDQYGHYEHEIAHWSGFPSLASIPFSDKPDKNFVHEQAQRIRNGLRKALTGAM